MVQTRWAILHGGLACRQGWSVVEVTAAVPDRTAMKTATAGLALGYPPEVSVRRNHRDRVKGIDLGGSGRCVPGHRSVPSTAQFEPAITACSYPAFKQWALEGPGQGRAQIWSTCASPHRFGAGAPGCLSLSCSGAWEPACSDVLGIPCRNVTTV